MALARVFLKNAPVLLLDEPTAGLDADTERRVLDAIESFRAGRTVLTVTHRLADIRRADRILVMEEGRIIEDGRPGRTHLPPAARSSGWANPLARRGSILMAERLQGVRPVLRPSSAGTSRAWSSAPWPAWRRRRAAVGLMSLSGWFIAAAALPALRRRQPVLFNFFLPSIGVRLFAILRTAARYAERVFTHEATFRILESLRVWFYRRIEPLAPAGLWRFRSGDILNRIVSDIEALDNLYLRVLSPAAVALLVSLLVCFLLAAFDGGIAATSGLLLALAGIGVSAAAARAGAAAGRAIAVRSADLRVRLVEGLQGLAEITLFGAVAEHLGRTDAKPVGSDRRRAADGPHPGRGDRGGEPALRGRRAGGPLRWAAAWSRTGAFPGPHWC